MGISRRSLGFGLELGVELLPGIDDAGARGLGPWTSYGIKPALGPWTGCGIVAGPGAFGVENAAMGGPAGLVGEGGIFMRFGFARRGGG